MNENSTRENKRRLQKEIRNALSIRPPSEAVKKIFWEIIGSDKKKDILNPRILPPRSARDVSQLAVLGQISDYRLIQVTVEKIHLWSQFSHVLKDIFGKWEDSLIILTDTRRWRWYLVRNHQGEPIAIEFLKNSDLEISLLFSIAMKVQRLRNRETLDVGEKIDESFEEHKGSEETEKIKKGLRDGARLRQKKEEIPATEDEWLYIMDCYPRLEDDEEKKLFAELKQRWCFPRMTYVPSDDLVVADNLYDKALKHHYWLVWAIARKRDWELEKLHSFDLCDLLMEGSIGLLEAIKEYNPGGYTEFRKFASNIIHKKIRDFIDRNKYYG